MAYNEDYLDILFGSGAVATGIDVYADEARRQAEIAAAKAEREASRCPRCMGEGRIAQFSHRKGGECFLCGGSGVFAGYRA